MVGRISSVESMGTLDGPGVRFVAFLQGCPLRCRYCHNPETWDPAAGQEIGAAELARQALRYRPYFARGGGVTLSGGEPLLQGEFVCEFLQLMQDNGVHTALDTSGAVQTPAALRALSLCDLVLLDVKTNSGPDYHELTGALGLEPVLWLLGRLREMQKPVWVRQVIVPGQNDTIEHARQLGQLLAPFPQVQRVELLPFKNLCIAKYDRLGIPFPLRGCPPMDPRAIPALLAQEEAQRLQSRGA